MSPESNGQAEDNISRLLTDSFNEAAAYLPRLIEALGKVALDLQRDDREQALQLFKQCIDGLDWIYQLTIKAAGIVSEVLGDERRLTLMGQGETLSTVFPQIVRSMENGDYVLMGDLLEYETVPLLEEISRSISVDLERINKGNNGFKC